ncbi:multisubunit sodium/proton antiporter, MrpA subunit /multisubunit sodium/proton antiporter, MrpB subunit [Agreia bicolorata]|uniref:Multisubunit sodium/proton antiporter, MrpA subunit /multisubunit sodium/proton antiporter, MrpB subunit n=1 Tax=Agreia bicolorata TaxID=110935 RepID=A0A1T4XGT3_9MICO|nr:Na+/H+ antiporter subunit A [Agreia bicolorata]SKA88703.1 multisubunit sodium/proton antiporter, MrpA subunit /multisubunit sodium/proton antiporter, MrpB subunit [Agreia bicolorata]
MIISLLGFALAGLVLPSLTARFGPRMFVVAAVVPATVFAWLLFQIPAVTRGETPTELHPWVPQLDLAFAFRLDALSLTMALIVTGVGALVVLYCARYFRRGEDGLGRFSGVLLAFAGAMFGLVVSDDIYVLFMFWEATTVFSYLLIGQYTAKRKSRGAALQALLVTTAGGLAMLVGVVILAVESGTTRVSQIVADPPQASGLVTVAVLLVLVGALSKSAQVPLHFWLPSAMAAPTPVSAYLHAAAMVKAGIFLIALLVPAFGDTPGWRPLLVGIGVLTMLVGGWRALRQHDLKLLLAYGTVSQLGFLTVVVGYGTRNAALAGITLITGHALFKATLFLVVGIIDNRLGTRDLRKISGLGRQAPLLAIVATLAAASMAGLPPLLGFVAKEATFTALLEDAEHGAPLGLVALIGVSLGSVLTVAYTARFLWGAFARKPGVEPAEFVHEHVDFLISPAILALTSLGLGIASPLLDPLFGLYADTVPPLSGEALAVSSEAPDAVHLALWHGLEPALGISAVTLVLGLALFAARTRVSAIQSRVPSLIDSARGYSRVVHLVDRGAVRLTRVTQTGSLPIYVATILVVLVAAVGTALALVGELPGSFRIWDSPAQLPIAIVMGVATIAAARAHKRFMAVVLVGVTGYGMAALFALQGAADLALTQALVETVTLVTFVLVLRRLPSAIGQDHGRRHRIVRAVIGVGVGILMSVVAVVALGSRIAEPISLKFPELAYEGGHGRNVVNVLLVDIRGWDTLGEMSVLVVAATGVASLVFLSRRSSDMPRLGPETERPRWFAHRKRMAQAPIEATASAGVTPDGAAPSQEKGNQRTPWLLAGKTLAPENRSIILEVVVRLLFHSAIIVSVYLLFAGHNIPGGGFAGGLVAGLAFVARYLAAGRFELGEAAPIDAGKLLGFGVLFAGGTALVPIFFGVDALTSTWFEAELPVIGHLEFVTSTLFDIGVYLVVVGLALDILRSLGAEIDRQQEEDHGDESSPDDGIPGAHEVNTLSHTPDEPTPDTPDTATERSTR